MCFIIIFLEIKVSKILSSIKNHSKGQGDICVLMHDTAAKDTTVEALPAIIEGLDAMGFRFAPITAETFGFHQRLDYIFTRSHGAHHFGHQSLIPYSFRIVVEVFPIRNLPADHPL